MLRLSLTPTTPRRLPRIGTAAAIAALPLLPAGALGSAAAHLAPAPALAAGANMLVRRTPLAFEPNRGQAEHAARFIARFGSYTLSLTEAGATLSLRPPSPTGTLSRLHGGLTLPPVPGVPPAVLGLRLAGANPHPRIRGESRLPGMVNYLIGPSPRGWHIGIPTYARVRYAAVYPGVDLIFRGNGGQLEYDFIVSPDADPARIRLAVTGAVPVLDRAGDLLLHTAAGVLRQRRPTIYQWVGGRRRLVPGGYLLLPGRRIGFRLGAYDHRAALVIDPLVIYATEFGAPGGGGDEANGLHVDAAGDAYIVGTTTSPSHKAIFVTKYDPTGTHPLYTTLLSGSCDSLGGDIAVDRAGDAYATGLYTSQDANGTCDVVQAVVAKLGPDGTPIYNVRFGGHQDIQAKDWGNGIAVDQAGNAYVTGETDNDPQFPTTPGALRSTPNAVGVDAFVLKVDPSGKLVYSTYLGGSDLDHAVGIAVDHQGDAYVVGQTASTDFPVTANAFQRRQGRAGDLGSAFVSKLNPTGSALLYSTYLGGSATDLGLAIALDSQGRAYVTGATSSPDFPTTPGAYSPRCGQDGHCGLATGDQNLCGGTGTCTLYDDAFVAEIDPSLAGKASLVYSTYLGGTLGDEGRAIAADGARHVYVAGDTSSLDFPVVAALQPARGAANNPLDPNRDAFVSELDLSRSGPAQLVFSTYLGGSADDVATGVAVGHNGTVYVAGRTMSQGFPARGHLNGNGAAFLAKLDTVTVDRAMLPAIDAVEVYHPVNNTWKSTTTVRRSEQTLLAVFFRPPKSGAPVAGRITLTYHGKSSQTFALVRYNDTQGDEVLGVKITWLQKADNLGPVHVLFSLMSTGAEVTAATDFTLTT